MRASVNRTAYDAIIDAIRTTLDRARTMGGIVQGDVGGAIIAPLRKRTRDGDLYVRPPNVQAALQALVIVSDEDIIARCRIGRDHPDHVSDECLMHCVRARRGSGSSFQSHALFSILTARVVRRLPRAEDGDGKHSSMRIIKIREGMLDALTDWLIEDRTRYCERLDFFEVRFNAALARLRSHVEESLGRETRRELPLALDEDTGEPSSALERAAGSFEPFEKQKTSAQDYRRRLDAAIDTLPAEQIRIIEMLKRGIPIDSTDPKAITIARTLQRSEKTIRNQRDKAYAALKALLTKGDEA